MVRWAPSRTGGVLLLFSVASAGQPLVPREELPPPTRELNVYREELEAWLRGRGASAEEAPTVAAAMVAFEEGIPWRSGEVKVGDGAVSLRLGEGDRYADPADASKILEAWGNPPDAGTLGMWVPAGAHLFGERSWAVLLTLQQDGWVDDAEAASIDYDDLLASMQESERASAQERRRQGLDGLELVGWAEPPRYDPSARVLYWATTIRSDTGNETLNYDVRILGRAGVLSLNAIASSEQLGVVKPGMERVRGLATFEPGHRYDDYEPGLDPKAAYGLAALVAGGAVAAKTGAFKGLLMLLLASKKLVVAGVVGLVGLARAGWSRVVGRRDPPR